MADAEAGHQDVEPVQAPVQTLAQQFQVNWNSLRMAKRLEVDDCNSIQSFAKLDEDSIHERVDADADAAAELAHALVKLVRVTGDAASVGLASCLASLVLSGGRQRVQLFVDADGLLPVQDFARALTGGSAAGVQVECAKAVSALLSGGAASQLANFSGHALLSWLNGQIQMGTKVSDQNLTGLRTAAALFRSRQLRLQFIGTPGVAMLCQYISSDPAAGVTPEVRYRASFCLWTISYYDEAVPALCAGNATVHLINRNLTNQDDKIARLALSTLVNLLNKEDAEQGVALNDVMVESNIMKSLLELSLRKWTAKDQKDVDSDIARLNKVLGSKFSSLNSFDRYMAELTTQQLKEGPMHTDKFWSENVQKFEHKDFLAIRLLVDLLSSEDSTTVVLACRDLGEFARFYDGGKKIIQHYKGKVKIMSLMASPDTAIQKAALMASAKLLINNWEHV